MKVSVVVPAYNEEKILGSCLRSLRSQTVDCEIVVCDNNSTDRTHEIAKKYAHRVIKEKKQGTMHALNSGTKIARGDLIAITGADCEVPANWIESFMPYFRDDRVIACYGPIDPLEDKHKRYFSMLNYAEKICIKLGLWFVIQGANFMVRRDILESAGHFDTAVKVFEENGLFKKIRKMGKVKFISKNAVKASTRRVEECGKLSLVLLGIRQMFKLSVYKRTDDHHFRAVRKQ